MLGMTIVQNYCINDQTTPDYNSSMQSGDHRYVERTVVFDGEDCIAQFYNYLDDHEDELKVLNNLRAPRLDRSEESALYEQSAQCGYCDKSFENQYGGEKVYDHCHLTVISASSSFH